MTFTARLAVAVAAALFSLVATANAQKVLRSQTVSFDNITAIEAVPFARFDAGAAIILADGGRAGSFIKVTSDYSALTTADPTKCVFIPSPQATDGSSGGWIRQEWLANPRVVKATWCGAYPDDSTDDDTEVQAAIDLIDAIATSGFLADAGGVLEMSGGVFDFGSGVTVPSSLDGLALKCAGGKGTVLQTNDVITIINWGPDLSGGGDTTSSDPTYFGEISDCVFKNSVTTQNAIAIQVNRSPQMLIDNVQILNFYVGIDGHRMNTTVISNSRISAESRVNTTPALAGIRLQGVYDSGNAYTPGGSVHLQDTKILGNSSDLQGMTHGLLVNSVDGLYVTGGTNYFGQVYNCITIDPLNTLANHIITDVKISDIYCDRHGNRSINMIGVVDWGGATGNSLYQDIWMDNIKLRGESEADYGIFIAVSDAGSFLSNSREVKNITCVQCDIGQFDVHGVSISGPETSRIAPVNVQFIGGTIDEMDGSATSGIRSEAKSLSIIGVNFGDNVTTPSRALDIELNSASISRTLTMIGNNFTDSDHSSEPYRLLNTGSGEIVCISGNNFPSADIGYNTGCTTDRGTLDSGWSVEYSGGTATDPTVTSVGDWLYRDGWVSFNVVFTFSNAGTPDTDNDQVQFNGGLPLTPSSRGPYIAACQIDGAAASPTTNPAVMSGPIAAEVGPSGVNRLQPIVVNAAGTGMIALRADQITASTIISCGGQYLVN